MDPELEFQLRHLAVPCSMAREHSGIFLRNLLGLVVTLPPMLAAVGYAALRLLRWTNEDPEQRYGRWLWLALWACGLGLLTTGVVAARFALRNGIQP